MVLIHVSVFPGRYNDIVEHHVPAWWDVSVLLANYGDRVERLFVGVERTEPLTNKRHPYIHIVLTERS